MQEKKFWQKVMKTPRHREKAAGLFWTSQINDIQKQYKVDFFPLRVRQAWK